MKVLILGSAGQLGNALVGSMAGKHDVTGLSRAEVDVTDRRQVHAAVARCRPHVVLNAAAMTDVDACERDPDLAYRVNALAVRWIAEASDQAGALLAHFSTDFVFSGGKDDGYSEWDDTGPIQLYGSSKLAGEQEARQARRNLVIRTSWLYGGPRKGFVRAILRKASEGHQLEVVTGQVGSPSYTGDVARLTDTLIREGVTGLVHVANAGATSRFEFAKEIVRIAGIDVDVTPLDVPPPSAIARRPRNTSLRTTVLGSLGLSVPTWQEGLYAFFREAA